MVQIYNISEGDYLQHGLKFYRVYSVGKDIVMNQILYHTIKNRLQMSHVYSFAEWHEIGTIYTYFAGNDPELLKKLEMIKRKYKLLKLNNINK